MRTPPPQLLLLGSIASVQFGSAFATKLFAQAGPGGVVFLRLAPVGAPSCWPSAGRSCAAAPGPTSAPRWHSA